MARPNTSLSTILLAVLASLMTNADGFAQVGVGTPVFTKIATPEHYEGIADGQDPVTAWMHVLTHPGATYIAIHFVDFDLGPGDYLVVSDLDGGQRYELSGRGKHQAGTFWARHIKGETVVLQLVVVSSSGGKGFQIDQYVAGDVELGPTKDPPVIESVCDQDDRKNAICYQLSFPTEYERGRAVARLLINGYRLCTGSLVSADNHVLTNEHCISTEAEAMNTDIEFMAEAPDCESANCQFCFPGVVYSGASLVKDDPLLDYAVIQITSGDPATSFGFLKVDNRDAIIGEQIYVPQHPDGRAKEFAVSSSHPSDTGGVCRIYSTTEPSCTGGGYLDIGYFADTEGGSSGAPVLASSNHEIIALHHCADCPNRAVPITQIYPEIKDYLYPGAAGVVLFTGEAYPCEGQVEIELRDGDLGGAGMVDLPVITSGGDAETVQLLETKANSAVFIGSIMLGPGAVVVDSGALEATEGEVITVTYADADDGTGSPALATNNVPVDCTPPAISSIAIANTLATQFTITFQTDEPAVGNGRAGIDCATLETFGVESSHPTSHSVVFAGLQPSTTYHYVIEATDRAGNHGVDDNGGACYTLTTPEASVYFTEHFYSINNDLDNHSLRLTPDGSSDFYRACIDSITGLPNDTTGATPLVLGDDSYAEVTIAGGQSVRLYGASYDRFYVGSNGYITFTEPDTAFNESPEAHFTLPRISALFDDLHTTGGGVVSWQQLGDRVVVTWDAVNEFGSASTNTMQVEMYFDGQLRMAWGQIGSNDGLAGISAGGDTPADYVPTDLTGLAPCYAPADYDKDTDVDQTDFGMFQLCLSGTNKPVPPGCDWADLDDDEDVDQPDFDLFKGCMTRSNVEAEPLCIP